MDPHREQALPSIAVERIVGIGQGVNAGVARRYNDRFGYCKFTPRRLLLYRAGIVQQPEIIGA